MDIPKNAIVFNHLQTEGLLKNGYVSGRGTALASGTAMVTGGISAKNAKRKTTTAKSTSKSSSKSSSKKSSSKSHKNSNKNNPGKNKNNDKNKDNKKAKWSLDKFSKWVAKFFDWVEIRLDRLSARTEKYIQIAERKVENGNFGGAASTYTKALNNTQTQIEANQAGSKKYQNQAERVLNQAVSKRVLFGTDGKRLKDKEQKRLAGEIRQGVKSGDIDISKYHESTQDVIKDYQQWYEKSLDCSKSVQDLLDQYQEYAEALYNLPLDKLNKKLESVNRTTELLEAQYDIADGSEAQNANLKQQNKAAKSELTSYRKYAKESEANLRKARHAIDAVGDKALAGVSKKQKNSIVSAVNAGDEIKYTAAEFNNLSPKAQKAIIKYNEALKANTVAASDAKKAEAEYTKTLRDNAVEMFKNVSDDYAGPLERIGNAKSQIDAYVDQTVAKGYKASQKFYNSLIGWEQQNLTNLTGQRDSLEAQLKKSVDSGVIKEGTKEWYEMRSEIDGVNLSIIKANTSIVELGNNIRQIGWDKFDDAQDGIGKLVDEAEFLIELLSMDELFNDDGSFTNAGQATQAMYAQNYNAYMRQADEYADEIRRINKEIANDPYNVDLLERRQDLIEAQRESIKAANDEKKSLQDLARDGIEKVLDKLKEMIDTYTDALDSAKDLRDYQKDISEQAAGISSIRKQLDAYQGDTSEETKKTIQQLKTDLVKAEQDLEDTQYDRYISDTKDLLEKVYDDYEKVLNERVDDIDSVVRDAIKASNVNASSIKTTIDTECGEVGMTLSTAMSNIWGETGIGGALATYSSDFSTAMTALNSAVNSIKSTVELIYSANDGTAGSQIGDVNAGFGFTPGNEVGSQEPTSKKLSNRVTKNSDGSYTFTVHTTNKGQRSIETETISAESILSDFAGLDDEKIVEIVQHTLEDKTWRDSHTTHGTGKGSRWADLLAILRGEKKYARGTRRVQNDQLAWTQERGLEAIVKPSASAILTPLSRGDMVLNAESTANLWKAANNPTDFLMSSFHNSGISPSAFVPAGDQIIQNTNHVEIDLPNVTNYEEFLNAARSDPKFEKLVQAMTTDRLAGRGAKVKNSIRW